jgi:hypothetical protein
MISQDLHVETLVPVGVQGFLDDAGCVGLFGIDSDDSKRVRETEDVSLGQPIRSDHY